MAIALQQLASTLPLLLFGLLALGVWRRLAPDRGRGTLGPARDRATLAWGLTTANFLIVGTYATAHSLLSALAIAMGKGSWPYEVTWYWAFPANVGRDAASVVYGAMLLGLMTLDRRAGLRIVAVAWRVLVAVAVLGTIAARVILPHDAYHAHFALQAVLFAATAIVLMAALVAAVLNDGQDLLLWLALTAYALKQVVTVSLVGVMASWAVAPQGNAMRILYWTGIAVGAATVALAARRLQLAAAGRRVPGVFEWLESLRRPAPAQRPL
ncbi:MAG TPA: hypothetical protein VFR37_10035 [Longimicrobium sp.]|nr:hypothetical protein [Longimicrobium sp.]